MAIHFQVILLKLIVSSQRHRLAINAHPFTLAKAFQLLSARSQIKENIRSNKINQIKIHLKSKLATSLTKQKCVLSHVTFEIKRWHHGI